MKNNKICFSSISDDVVALGFPRMRGPEIVWWFYPFITYGIGYFIVLFGWDV